MTIPHLDARIDEYIDQLPEWQQEICRQERAVVHAADPEVEETMKRSVQPYFVLEGNVCALLAAKDHVNVFIYDPTVADPRASSIKAKETPQPGASRLPGRRNQSASPAGDIPRPHRTQPRRRLETPQIT